MHAWARFVSPPPSHQGLDVCCCSPRPYDEPRVRQMDVVLFALAYIVILRIGCSCSCLEVKW